MAGYAVAQQLVDYGTSAFDSTSRAIRDHNARSLARDFHTMRQITQREQMHSQNSKLFTLKQQEYLNSRFDGLHRLIRSQQSEIDFLKMQLSAYNGTTSQTARPVLYLMQ